MWLVSSIGERQVVDRTRGEAGQVTPLLALVAVFLIGVAVSVATIGRGLVDRRQAVVAADTVALAAVIDPAAADDLAGWYSNYGIAVNHDAAGASATSGEAQARAWAVVESGDVTNSPAIAARMARAEQLIGRELAILRSFDLTVVVSETTAAHLQVVAHELGLCMNVASDVVGEVTFEVC